MQQCSTHYYTGYLLNIMLSVVQIETYGLDHRNEVHEIEFLSLLAFVARERQRLRTNTNPNTKFTRSDLEMAYAFKQQFGTRKQAPVNPLYESPARTSDHADFDRRRSDPKRLSQLFPKSPTESAIEAMSSPTSHYTSQFDRRASLRNSSSQPNPLFPQTVFNTSALTPQHQPKVPPLSSSRNSSGVYDVARNYIVNTKYSVWNPSLKYTLEIRTPLH